MIATLRLLVGFLAALAGSGCLIGVGPEQPAGAPLDPTVPRTAYDPGTGEFVVHEWGTLTNVVACDGSLLPGLHHEEEDLPGFVIDRLAHGKTHPKDVLKTWQQKMETPVTYFYSPTPRRVMVQVGFPRGILTQWFPAAVRTYPMLVELAPGSPIVDRWLEDPDSIPPACRSRFSGEPTNGLLDWGEIDVLAPQERADLPGPLGDTTWGFARNTMANPVRATSPTGAQTQAEKFLFYRGLGNFDLPLAASCQGDGRLAFANGGATAPMGGMILMNITPTAAGFVELGDLRATDSLAAEIPAADRSHRDFVADLRSRLAARLVGAGLFTDEATAMVDTWERSYFLTPGVRLLYVLPQANTDRVIPLSIAPAPQKVVRVMVIRVEIVTPEQEQKLSTWLTALGVGTTTQREAARASFLGLGRFAEPHLTRAVRRATTAEEIAAGQSLLTEVRAQRRWAPTAAE